MNESFARLSRTSGGGGRARGGFTLIELLVAMGVIAVLAVLTLMSMRGIANDARMASATNTVKAALDNARALAMKNNTIVLVVFRPRLVGTTKQEVDIYTAKWTGESAALDTNNDGSLDFVVDRFVPIPAIVVRTIPAGIKVAAPKYGGDDEDDLWITQAHLPAINQETGSGEAPGKMIAIMYGPDGTTITRNSQSDSNRMFVDFNNDRLQRDDADLWDYSNNNNYPGTSYFDQTFEDDEPFLAIAPFLAVFDDDEAREIFDTTAWIDEDIRREDITEYVTQFAKRIHFNRYTGVVMK